MKLSKIVLSIALISAFYSSRAQGTSIVGSWQLIRESNCLEQRADAREGDSENLRDEMRSHASASAQIVSFKGNASGEESARILNSGKVSNTKKFLYKFNGDMLLILDKKSQTISDSYLVDKFSADSLILSNSSRPCETKIFVKINGASAN